jgi:hypothetical protein
VARKGARRPCGALGTRQLRASDFAPIWRGFLARLVENLAASDCDPDHMRISSCAGDAWLTGPMR